MLLHARWWLLIPLPLYISSCSSAEPSTTITCAACIPQELLDAPGVGFDLNDAYATVSVRWRNETMDVARFDGGSRYKRMMKRLAKEKKAQPKAKSIDPTWKHVQRADTMQSTSNVDKNDAQILGRMLKVLRKLTELRLGMPIHAVVVTHPYLPSLNKETTRQAFEYAGLLNLESNEYFNTLQEHGIGYLSKDHLILESWEHLRMLKMETCFSRHCNENRISTLVFSLTGSSLEFLDMRTKNGYEHTEWAMRDRSYGRSSIPDLGMDWFRDTPKDIYFWRRVREAIIAQISLPQRYERVVLLGEGTAEPKFREALGDAFIAAQAFYLLDQVQGVNYDPLFEAARGAAEFAKTCHGETWNCVEPRACVEERIKTAKEVWV